MLELLTPPFYNHGLRRALLLGWRLSFGRFFPPQPQKFGEMDEGDKGIPARPADLYVTPRADVKDRADNNY